MNYLVWTQPDGSIAVTSLVRDDDARLQSQVAEKLLRDHAVAPGSTYQLVTSRDDLEALAPRHSDGRSAWDIQHQWRKQGTELVIDSTVPDPPRPRQALRQALDAAKSVNDIKAVVKELLR